MKQILLSILVIIAGGSMGVIWLYALDNFALAAFFTFTNGVLIGCVAGRVFRGK